MKKIIWIKSRCSLRFSNNNLVIKKDEMKEEIYLGYISTIIVDSLEVSFSTYLINELSKNNICLIMIDEKHNPCYVVSSIYNVHNQTERIKDQLSWTLKRKKHVWNKNIKNKISMQEQLIERLYKEKNSFKDYLKRVKNGDMFNCEASVSKKYFSKLFGSKFIRHNNDDLNSALNYGYTLLLSLVNKIVVSHGYLSFFGIHHKANTNNYNLSSDVMEPFRPLVDEIVFQNKNSSLDKDYKRKLMSLYEKVVIYNGKEYLLENAIEKYFLDIILSMNDGKSKIGEISFVNE